MPADRATPAGDRFLEDYQPGVTETHGPVTVTEEEIVEFARRFDPQPFHVDPVAAKRSLYGGIIASGWHTASLMMRLFADHVLSPASSLGSPGIDELRWPHPVRGGDRLWLHATVLDKRLSRSKPDRGITRTAVSMTNQDGRTVLSLVAVGLVATRVAAGAQPADERHHDEQTRD